MAPTTINTIIIITIIVETEKTDLNALIIKINLNPIISKINKFRKNWNVKISCQLSVTSNIIKKIVRLEWCKIGQIKIKLIKIF